MTTAFADQMWAALDEDKATRRSTPPATTDDVTPATTGSDVVVISDPAKYAATALQRAADEFGSVGAHNQHEGAGRNHALNTAAFTLGRLVSAGLLTEHAVRQALTDAASRNGLLQWTGHHAVDNTISSGLRAGALEPLRWTQGTSIGPVPEAAPFAAPGWLPTQPGAPALEAIDPDALHRMRVQAELANLRARDEAKQLLEAEKAERDFRTPPSRFTVLEELQLPDEEVTYAVDKVLPTGSNALLTAAYKTGKSTTIGDLAAAHADGGQFLNKFSLAPTEGRLAIFNYELSDTMYRRWLRELQLQHPERIAVLHLRGYRMPLIVPSVETWVVNWLKERDVTRWVVDPFARAFTGCGDENDNGHVGRFLDTLDVIKERAGIGELVLPTHTGRMQHEEGQERARGATRLDDWADVRWMLTKTDDDRRFFSATGRDVDEPEELLTYDEQKRRYTKAGGDRKTEAKKGIESSILEVIENRPGVNLTDLRSAVGGKASSVDSALKNLLARHLIRLTKVGNTNTYSPAGIAGFITPDDGR